MTITEFIAKWRRVDLTERSASQQHFLDLCALVGQSPPAAADPTGADFCFEKGAGKAGGGEGWADVWKRGHFAWEYKGRLANLTTAYQQLLQYKDALDNPPLLVVSDMERFVIRTNFTNTPARRIEFTCDDLIDERNLAVLRAVFFDPDRLKPEKTTQRITEDAAERITQIATSLRERGIDAQQVARFLDRVVFCLFAEDVGLLPDQLFTRLVAKAHGDPKIFSRLVAGLFEAMAHGGEFGVETVHHFNGHLFSDADVLTLTGDELDRIHLVTGLDWSAIDPSIFGTLFERALDPAKRSQLGAHYTSRDDIETIVDPVVMAPLLREWDGVRSEVDALLTPGHKKTDAEGRREDPELPAPPAARHRARSRLRLRQLPLRRPAEAEEPREAGHPLRHGPGILGLSAAGRAVATARDRDQPLRLRTGADDRVDRLAPVDPDEWLR
jgi:hypothetical protein